MSMAFLCYQQSDLVEVSVIQSVFNRRVRVAWPHLMKKMKYHHSHLSSVGVVFVLFLASSLFVGIS